MNAKEELQRWKADFAKAQTHEQKVNHHQRFKEYVQSLNPADQKEFVEEYQRQASEAVAEAERLKAIVERKQKMQPVLDFVSASYIAQHYFGKTRQWLYQRINGNKVNGKTADFTPEEIKTLSKALDEMGEAMKHLSCNI